MLASLGHKDKPESDVPAAYDRVEFDDFDATLGGTGDVSEEKQPLLSSTRRALSKARDLPRSTAGQRLDAPSVAPSTRGIVEKATTRGVASTRGIASTRGTIDRRSTRGPIVPQSSPPVEIASPPVGDGRMSCADTMLHESIRRSMFDTATALGPTKVDAITKSGYVPVRFRQIQNPATGEVVHDPVLMPIDTFKNFLTEGEKRCPGRRLRESCVCDAAA